MLYYVNKGRLFYIATCIQYKTKKLKKCSLDTPGLQITTRPLANASKFSCGRLNDKNPLAHMASENLPELFRILRVI